MPETRKATLADLGFSEDTAFGDCVDCNQCVKVCPMGIDIRNGTQLECIHCTACIDACDDVMIKIDKPVGLIRYSSENIIRDGEKKFFTPRIAGYSAVLIILFSIFTTLLLKRSEVETTMFRQPGTLYQELPNGIYSNIYQIKVINKTFDTKNYEIKLISPKGVLTPLGNIDTIPPQELVEGRFLVKINEDDLEGLQTEIEFAIFADGKQIDTKKTGFLGPAN